MGRTVSHPVTPGGLAPTHHVEIRKYAARGWKAARIAQRIEKHPATVQWFMYREGFVAPRYRKGDGYWRGGRFVKPFTPTEDAYIEARRTEGAGPTQIAAEVTAKFGHPRSHSTIRCRLVMLAAREVA